MPHLVRVNLIIVSLLTEECCKQEVAEWLDAQHRCVVIAQQAQRRREDEPVIFLHAQRLLTPRLICLELRSRGGGPTWGRRSLHRRQRRGRVLAGRSAERWHRERPGSKRERAERHRGGYPVPSHPRLHRGSGRGRTLGRRGARCRGPCTACRLNAFPNALRR